MATATVQQLRCPSCGAGCVWNPAAQKLMCRACGGDAARQPDLRPHGIAHDLGAALGAIDETDAQCRLAPRTVPCGACAGLVTFADNVTGRDCDSCGATVFLADAEIAAAVRPHAVLPFAVDASRARDEFTTWLAEQPLTPGNVARRSRIERIDCRYVPYWTFDTAMQCYWHAEAGHHEQEQVYVTNAKGEEELRTVTVTRWEPAAGVLEDTFREEAVPGTDGLPLERLKHVEPFPTAEAAPYDAALLAGYRSEHYRVPLAEASRRWYALMWTKLTALCAERVPGDTQRNLRIETFYKGQAFRLVLVPIILLTYRYGRAEFQVLMNGRTGRAHGDAPVSGWKMAFVLLLIVVGLGLLAAAVLWLVRALGAGR
jgi:hypothetical protein